MLLSFAYGGLFFSVLTLQCFDPSMFWPFNFLPITHYRPSTSLFGKIGYEIFYSNFFMIYTRSEKKDKERSLEHVQQGLQKPQHSSINFAVPNKTSIHTRIQKWHWFSYWNYTWDNRNNDFVHSQWGWDELRTWSPSVLHDGLNATNISTCENLCKTANILLVKL